MAEALNQWIENIAVYSVLLVLVLHMLPSGDMKKYVRFFLGLLFILIVFRPILSWTLPESGMADPEEERRYTRELEEFQERQERLQEEMQQYEEENGYDEQGAAGDEAGDEAGTQTGTEGAAETGQPVEPIEIHVDSKGKDAG